jgi:hypothetical protein
MPGKDENRLYPGSAEAVVKHNLHDQAAALQRLL